MVKRSVTPWESAECTGIQRRNALRLYKYDNHEFRRGSGVVGFAEQNY